MREAKRKSQIELQQSFPLSSTCSSSLDFFQILIMLVISLCSRWKTRAQWDSFRSGRMSEVDVLCNFSKSSIGKSPGAQPMKTQSSIVVRNGWSRLSSFAEVDLRVVFWTVPLAHRTVLPLCFCMLSYVCHGVVNITQEATCCRRRLPTNQTVDHTARSVCLRDEECSPPRPVIRAGTCSNSPARDAMPSTNPNRTMLFQSRLQEAVIRLDNSSCCECDIHPVSCQEFCSRCDSPENGCIIGDQQLVLIIVGLTSICDR